MICKIKCKKNRGASLIELIIYIALTSIMLVAINSFVFMVIEARSRNIVINEVEQQGAFAMQKISQYVRNADTIITPVAGSSASTLSVASADFDLSSAILQITEGGSTVDLTNNRLIMSDLEFTNVSLGGTPGSLRIEFVLTYDNPGAKEDLNYSKKFYGAASLR